MARKNEQPTIEEAQLMTSEEVADLLKVSRRLLALWRQQSRGPRYYLMGRLVRYRMSDVLAWQQESLSPVRPMR